RSVRWELGAAWAAWLPVAASRGHRSARAHPPRRTARFEFLLRLFQSMKNLLPVSSPKAKAQLDPGIVIVLDHHPRSPIAVPVPIGLLLVTEVFLREMPCRPAGENHVGGPGSETPDRHSNRAHPGEVLSRLSR